MSKFLKQVIALVCLICVICAGWFDLRQAGEGEVTGLGGITTEKTRDYILETFGDAEAPLELAYRVYLFALDRFAYDETGSRVFQTANNERFIFQRHFSGVCLDFSAFVKTVFCVVCEEKGWDNVSCYVALGYTLPPDAGHAVNYITIAREDGAVTIYELDITWDLSRREEGKKLQALSYHQTVESAGQVTDTIRQIFGDFYKYKVIFLK